MTQPQGSKWHVEWYWPDDTILLRFEGYLTSELLTEALDGVTKLHDEAGGDLKIYTMVDQSQVDDADSNAIGQTAIHSVFFHPRGGRTYFVGCNRQMRSINETLNDRRPDSVRFFETVEEAAADIQGRRAAYRARQQAALLGKAPTPPSSQAKGTWESSWHQPDDILLITYKGFLSDGVLIEGLDDLTRKFDEAEGDLRIYSIADQRQVTGYSDTINVSAALHPGFFHPRAGKLYVLPPTDEALRSITEALNSRRPDTVRFANSIEEATEDIRKRRAAYLAKLGKG